MSSTTIIALFDTDAGFLQWIGKAEDHKAAIRAHLADIGFNDAVSYRFLALDLSDEQGADISAWWAAGGKSPDYPEGLPSGVTYDADEVRAMRICVTLVNPFSGATVERDVTDLTKSQLDAYPLDEAVCNSLAAKIAPCTPGEFLAAYVDRVGPVAAGVAIIGG
jgi:hypothetical protein